MIKFVKSWKDNIFFVLVGPEELGNIGASARALKNMGFKNLELIEHLFIGHMGMLSRLQISNLLL